MIAIRMSLSWFGGFPNDLAARIARAMDIGVGVCVRRDGAFILGSRRRRRLERRLLTVRKGDSVASQFEFFCRAALLEVFDGTINLNPIMFRLLKNRSDGGRVF